MLQEIQWKIQTRQYELSRHALDQSIQRGITITELEDALMGDIEIIEDYPNDKYGLSCLLLGFTDADRALHVLCSYPSRPRLKVITLYEPDPIKWLENRVRRNL
jgi:hypothetical protein